MVWLAGFALAFFVIALCFVSMGFLRTDLKQAGAARPSSPSVSTPDISSTFQAAQNFQAGQNFQNGQAPAASANEPQPTGITVISRSVSDILSGKSSRAAPDSVDPAQEATSITAAAAPIIQDIMAVAAASLPVVPRLKPEQPPRMASVTATGTKRIVPTPIDMNATWLADNIRLGFAHANDFTGGATPIFTASEREAPLPDTPATGNIVRLRSGESLSEALTRLQVRPADQAAAINALSQETDVRSLRPGTQIDVSLIDPQLTVYQEAAYIGQPELAPGKALRSLTVQVSNDRRIEVQRDAAAQFTARTILPRTQKRYATVSGTITDSLFASAAREGMPHAIAARLSNMFLYDIDFQREIHYGDEFEAVYEVFYDDQGRVVDYGDVLYGRMSWRGGKDERGYYRFDDGNDISWFDATGESARRLLMKTPIEGARITSSFGMRKHPVLGYTKGHKGTDFGASTGTPIMAAGDGVIERAGPFSSYGNYVKIKHSSGYETAYAHLNGFAKGIKAGTRVRQGDIIGYVGSTGRSTGPHLHYEVLYNGSQVNPMTIKVADGRKLDGSDHEAFTSERDWIEAMRAKARPLTLASAQAAGL
ncbi:M23 family metallopeptidase [Aquisalinus flavus]|uniref:M23ase beta-sheet core domain-containing protein n=1 Tax=Aquisalinus flavus TaxID=1526572 RepID=A0A8J2Y5U8_9PROT|nr:peptidoglycan DD-metalloendopeptidase family protein [Aquisalinus flavus]MBD0427560.1 peptidoglycan DD-metalloendopeptidase family protein [Aquisalinus flavus]GGD01923.1 hypothetical protein GCM10011342_08730 [Aquisalinus flavus]